MKDDYEEVLSNLKVIDFTLPLQDSDDIDPDKFEIREIKIQKKDEDLLKEHIDEVFDQVKNSF